MKLEKKNSLKKLKINRVAAFGAWDTFHYGHMNLLKKAKERGNYLLVGVASDERVKQFDKKCVYPAWLRKKTIESLGIADKVVLIKSINHGIEVLKKYKIDEFIKGDDWKGKSSDADGICKVTFLPYTKGVSTTKIKKYIVDWLKE